jgi:hypothetical protein
MKTAVHLIIVAIISLLLSQVSVSAQSIELRKPAVSEIVQ